MCCYIGDTTAINYHAPHLYTSISYVHARKSTKYIINMSKLACVMCITDFS